MFFYLDFRGLVFLFFVTFNSGGKPYSVDETLCDPIDNHNPTATETVTRESSVFCSQGFMGIYGGMECVWSWGSYFVGGVPCNSVLCPLLVCHSAVYWPFKTLHKPKVKKLKTIHSFSPLFILISCHRSEPYTENPRWPLTFAWSCCSKSDNLDCYWYVLKDLLSSLYLSSSSVELWFVLVALVIFYYIVEQEAWWRD